MAAPTDRERPLRHRGLGRTGQLDAMAASRLSPGPVPPDRAGEQNAEDDRDEDASVVAGMGEVDHRGHDQDAGAHQKLGAARRIRR